jgi:tRNA pseudouridine13 synthase
MITLHPPQLEVDIGLQVYGTDTSGIGGRIRVKYEDFVVQEVLGSGEVAMIDSQPAESISGSGGFLLCILVKSGIDTFEALRTISRMLKVNQNRISAAGLKDAKALTAQHVTIRQANPRSLSKTASSTIRLSPIRFTDSPITAKSLLGNNFRVTIRDIEQSSQELQKSSSELWSTVSSVGGVPNFYGHQRFGTLRPITHKIGKHIVKREFKEAVLTYLTAPSAVESQDSREAKRIISEEGNAKKSLSLYPKRLLYERSMLEYLARFGEDYVGALARNPLGLRRLFVNAYQSFLFNKVLSLRITRGLPLNNALEGDRAVLVDSYGLPIRQDKVLAANTDSINETIKEGRAALALPVIGYSTGISGGRQGEIETEVLNEEGVTPRDFYVGPLHEASSSGKYRAALARVTRPNSTVQPDEINLGKLSLTLDFFLPKESYATIVLRELMKPKDITKAGF